MSWHKVVIRFDSETIKAYMPSHLYGTVEDFSRTISERPPMTLKILRRGSEVLEELNVEDAKAIFHVKTFDGDKCHRDLKFHTRAPIVHGIWMRVEFSDGEVMEGITQNTLHYVVDPGFLLYPTDPRSNNRLAYVLKKRLTDVTVLGLRNPSDMESGGYESFIHLCKQ